MRFIERTHKSKGIGNILTGNPIAFFCLISKEDFKNDTPFDRAHFSRILVKNNILKKKINSKLSFAIKSTCFLIFPKDKSIPVTTNFIKWLDNIGINLLFIKCDSRYYSSLISSMVNKKGVDNLVIIIRTLTNALGKVNTIVDKINGIIYKALKKITSQTS